jgi:hypothetical protein
MESGLALKLVSPSEGQLREWMSVALQECSHVLRVPKHDWFHQDVLIQNKCQQQVSAHHHSKQADSCQSQ